MTSRPLPAERYRDLVADALTPWVPTGPADEARFRSAVRRATRTLGAPFALPPEYEIGWSELLVTNPDGTQGWMTSLHFMRAPAAAGAAAAAALLSAWTQLFVDVGGEHGRVATRGEVVATGASVARHGLPDLFWANLFGPRLVQAIGQAVLLGAPAERSERLGGGGVLLLRDADPWSWDSAAAARRRKQLRAHLGPRLFARRSWPGGKPIRAAAPLHLGASSLSPSSMAEIAGRYLGAAPEGLFADPEARRRELAALLRTEVAALACDRRWAALRDDAGLWDELADGERARWVAPLAFHIGDCVARARGGRWAVHPDLREPVVELPDGRFLRPLVEAQDIVFDEGRIEEVLARAGALAETAG